MYDGDGQRQPLAYAQRQLRGALVEIVLKAELFGQLAKTRLRFPRRQVKKPCMKLEVLPDGELGVEREGLRHVADTPARVDVARVERPAKQQCLAFGRRQQAGQHLHCRRFAAAVRADKAEDFAAFDGEAHPIDGGKVAEAARQIAGGDDRFGADDAAQRYFQSLATCPALFRQERYESVLDRRRARLHLQIVRGSGGENFPGVHRNKKVEARGLFHIGGCDHHAHARTARADARDQFPELAARQRIDAGRRFVEDQKIGIVDERAA